MNLLLDTHLLIWALNADSRLPKKVKAMILDKENAIYYSTVSIWEVSIKHAVHPENVSFTGEVLSAFCREAGYIPLEIREGHVFALETLRRFENAPSHGDPFDRMLIAQAKAERMLLLTADSFASYYDEKCIVQV